MYENRTFSFLLNRMLDSVSNTIDKREGSVIYDALAPAAAELAQMYIELDVNRNLSFADTASAQFLTRRAAEFGVQRVSAAKARRRGEFYNGSNAPLDVPIGSRYSIEGLVYIVVSRISVGQFALEAEEPGVIGNQFFGALLPIDYVTGLARAELLDVLVPGEDEESDEMLRQRYYEVVNEPAFGGNIADYKQKLGAIPGVGAVKVFPVWNGGGTIKAMLIAADWNAASAALIEEVQAIADPVGHTGQGMGLAPIGHVVTIAAVQEITIEVDTTITLEDGFTLGQVQADVEAAIADYLLQHRQSWALQNQIVVRIAQIEARILTVPGVQDVSGTELNGSAANLVLLEEQIPQLGTVTLHV